MADGQDKQGLDFLALSMALNIWAFNSEMKAMHISTLKIVELMYNIANHILLTKLYYTGSGAEGTSDTDSDYDCMLLHKTDVIVIEEDNVPHGFARLKILGHIPPGLQNTFKVIDKGDNVHYISSRVELSRNLLSLNDGIDVHGPAMGDQFRLFDMVNCFESYWWPKQAQEWLLRKRKFQWPTKQQTEKAEKDGCLLVPVGSPDIQTQNLEWRISFSLLERDLIWSWNRTQTKCYILLKMIVRSVISPVVPGVLNSYQLKTLMFWQIEQTDSSIWVPDNLVSLTMTMLRKMLACVKSGSCPHYFIRDNNLFAAKLHGQNKQLLVRKLQDVIHKGLIECIKQVKLLHEHYNFAASYKGIDLEYHNTDIYKHTRIKLHTNCCSDIGMFIHALIDDLFGNLIGHIGLRKAIQNQVKFIEYMKTYLRLNPLVTRSVVRFMLTFVYSCLGSHQLAMAMRENDQNIRDALLAKALYHLELGKHHGLFYGKFKLAMFYYNIGQYSAALDFMFNGIDKATAGFTTGNDTRTYIDGESASNETIQNTMRSKKLRLFCEKHNIGKSTLCSETRKPLSRKSTLFVSENALLPDHINNYYEDQGIFITYAEASTMPLPIQYESACLNVGITKAAPIDALSLFYFMQFMCFYQLNNGYETRRSLEDFHSYSYSRSRSGNETFNLLAHCYFMMDDVKSVCKALASSMRVYPYRTHKAGIWMLAVRLFKLFIV